MLYAAGGILRIWPVFVLGRPFSELVAIQCGHSLVTTDIYGVIRHPSYLGALMFMLGGALVFRSGVGILLAAAILVPVLARIASEEKLLQSQFGAEYDAYRAHLTACANHLLMRSGLGRHRSGVKEMRTLTTGW
jgi:protein-S-isoprenylcysteine O-methyltransferase Ste14